jgi:hypothetical protein
MDWFVLSLRGERHQALCLHRLLPRSTLLPPVACNQCPQSAGRSRLLPRNYRGISVVLGSLYNTLAGAMLASACACAMRFN